jgi:hypothetical protein
MLEFPTKRLVLRARAPQGESLLPALDFQGQPVLGGVELDVDHVLDRVAVDGQQPVAGPDAQRGGGAVRLDGRDAAHRPGGRG